MSALSIDKAIKLYHMLEYFLPDSSEDNTALKFIAKVVYNIKETGNHRVYLDALALMQGTDIDTIISLYTPEESLNEFNVGLQENRILALKEFCDQVGI